uniref:quinolinate synthase NadA n=1 Tax=uncultured Ellagibacter sp. TaxID=2137580 RepID=UPI002620DE84
MNELGNRDTKPNVTHASDALASAEHDAAVNIEALSAEIERLKTSQDAVILAHYYVPPEVQDVADYVGDSFALAKLAVDLPQQTIVLCGVEFMGESAKLLNPEKTVLLPEPAADCPMAHMIRKADIDSIRAKYAGNLAVVCYVNS